VIQVKICGLCRPEDAAVAGEAGADWIGVILSPGYARSQTLSEAAAIFAAAGGVRRVGVLVDAEPDLIARAIDTLRLDAVQLHGAESPELVATQGAAGTVWKALRVSGGEVLPDLIRRYHAAHGLLLEPLVAGAAGGTGARLDWTELAPMRPLLRAQTFVLAGGLSPDNVAGAIAALDPDIVDVSSGVEAEVGRKSWRRVQEFVQAARSAVLNRENRT